MTICPRTECGAVMDDDGVCNTCGCGSKLADVPDYESGRLFDEWWVTVPYATMLEYGEAGTVQDKFDEWRAARSTKH